MYTVNFKHGLVLEAWESAFESIREKNRPKIQRLQGEPNKEKRYRRSKSVKWINEQLLPEKKNRNWWVLCSDLDAIAGENTIEREERRTKHKMHCFTVSYSKPEIRPNWTKPRVTNEPGNTCNRKTRCRPKWYFSFYIKISLFYSIS